MVAIFTSHKNDVYQLQLQKLNDCMIKKVLAVFVLLMSFDSLLAQDKKKLWIDSVFQTLNTRDKIGQLFIVPASSYYEEDELDDLEDQIKDNRPGGILITGGGPVGTVNLINRLQKISTTPLLVVIDAESGPGKTLDSLITFPNALSLGAIADDTLIYSLGAEIARQMKALGLHMNLAPNADIDVLMGDPSAYFGSSKFNVTRKSVAMMRGLQDNGIIAIAKHSARSNTNGNENEQSLLDFTNNRLDTLNFYPYQQLIKQGIKGMLTTNLHFSTEDKKKPIPASISQLFISDMLKTKIGFDGLTITDIPYFHELAGKSKAESEKLAFEVGNDLLLNPQNLNGAVKRIEAAMKRNIASKLRLEIAVKKILGVKYDVMNSAYSTPSADNLISRINSPKTKILKYELSKASVTIARNDKGLLPIQDLDNKTFASVSFGSGNDAEFENYLVKYTHFDRYQVEQINDTLQLSEKLASYDVVVVGLYSLNRLNANNVMYWLNKLGTHKQIIICSYGNPYDLNALVEPAALVMAFTDESPKPMIVAQSIFGVHPSSGSTPLSIHHLIDKGISNPQKIINRLGYGIPEQVGMKSEVLNKIEEIVAEALDSGATPGCNILIARKGTVVYDKAIGWKTYEKLEPVSTETIYDLASITKVAATLQTVMFMYDKNLIDINKKVSVYLPELKGTNKENFTFKDILTHQAGLWPYLPFWQQTLKDSTLLPEYYSHSKSEAYPLPVSKDLFAKKSMKDSLWHWIINAKIREKKPKTPFDYTYSDMGFYIMQHVAEKLLNQPMQDFLSQNIYEPIGATTTGFLPMERFPESQIAPTEVDKQFRGSKLVGYVHDQGAAMHGGVAGHAGLFSDANDLAKMGQMWLQKGNYGGVQYFKPETLDLFTQKQYETSRRGLGWDKPTLSDWNGPTSLFASPKTFGHTGFTGTAIWVDPEFDLVFVFLSNRVYPDMFNTKLLSANIRPRIQDVIYQSIFEYCKQNN